MRTIKFRQHNKKQNRWHYWGFVSKGQFVNPVDNPDGDWSESYQFTGLTDKNGKEIYEGDIIEVPVYEEGFENGWFRIGFNDETLSWWAYGLDEEDDMPLHEIGGEFYERGNIYENPELLEK